MAHPLAHPPGPPFTRGRKSKAACAQQNRSFGDRLFNPVNPNFAPRQPRPPEITQGRLVAFAPDRVARRARRGLGASVGGVGAVEEPADLPRDGPGVGVLRGPMRRCATARASIRWASDASACEATARTLGSAASSLARPIRRVTTSHCTARATAPARPSPGGRPRFS